MTYKEAKDFINQSAIYGSVLGLETITALLGKLGNPQDELKVIHIAGTNGKGSTSAFISAIMAQAGYRIGRYISPVVFNYNEIIQIEDREKILYISENDISNLIEKIKKTCETMVNEGYNHPTPFEIETAMTFLYLKEQKVDFVVLETGLGGRLDATNVIQHSICSVFTSISYDHMNYLGNTLAEITYEKSGIIKNQSAAIIIEQEKEILEIIQQRCVEQESQFIIAQCNENNLLNLDFNIEYTSFTIKNENDFKQYKIKLLGKHQIKNAVLALKVIEYLNSTGYHINEEAVERGLNNTVWSGRFEIISKKPYFVIDGAHNADASMMLREAILQYFKGKNMIYIIGVLADKEYIDILKNTGDLANKIITITPNSPRALKASLLAEVASEFCDNVLISDSLEEAIKEAYQWSSEEDVIIAFGSLSFLSDIKKYFDCNELSK